MDLFKNYNAKDSKFAYKLISPAILVIIILLGIPLGYAFWQSFHEVTAFLPEGEFIGLQNYIESFKDPVVRASFFRSIIFVFFTLSTSFFLGLIGALLLNRDIFGRRIFRACLLLPFLVSGVAVGVIWRWLFASEIGVINNMLVMFGFSPISWLANTTTAMISIIIANSWRFFPFPFIILLAGLQQIDQMYYDAARIDGANRFQAFWNITIPMLKPMINISLIYLSFASFNQFATIFSLTGGGPGRATEVLALHMYGTAFQRFRWGYGSALAIMLFLINVFLSGSYNKLLETEER